MNKTKTKTKSISVFVENIEIKQGGDCFVIAEIGHNHQGDFELCKRMIRKAKECGATAVKLQKRDNKTLYTTEMYNKPYDNENSYGATYGEHREFLEFDKEQYRELQAYAREVGIIFFATAFDFPSADLLRSLDMPAYKIASGDIKNTPLLKHIAGFGKPMFISTGACGIEDVKRAYDTVMPINNQIVLLQCTAGYPPKYEEINLKVLDTYKELFPDVLVGLSSHDSGTVIAAVAYAMGASVVEKHYTLQRASKGTDHVYSLESSDLRELMMNLKNIKAAMGDGVKTVYDDEKAPAQKMGKSLYYARALAAGEVLGAADIDIKSPGGGTPPYALEEFVGKVLVLDVSKEQMVDYDHVVKLGIGN